MLIAIEEFRLQPYPGRPASGWGAQGGFLPGCRGKRDPSLGPQILPGEEPLLTGDIRALNRPAQQPEPQKRADRQARPLSPAVHP